MFGISRSTLARIPNKRQRKYYRGLMKTNRVFIVIIVVVVIIIAIIIVVITIIVIIIVVQRLWKGMLI